MKRASLSVTSLFVSLALLFTACGSQGSSSSTTATNSYQITVTTNSGEHQMNTTLVYARNIDAEEGVPAHVMLYFNEDQERVVFFQLFETLDPGTYSLGDEGSPITAMYLESSGSNIYTVDSGTLTLTQTGTTFGGQFEFSGHAVFDANATFTAKGAFADLALDA